MNTIQEVVRDYCYRSDSSALALPPAGVVADQHIVVTTFSTAVYLVTMPELRGHFTHIFIDEAAQALECEVAMPLALASTDTCVVLAGDHLQIKPEIYSPEARRQGLDRYIKSATYIATCDVWAVSIWVIEVSPEDRFYCVL